MVGGWAYNFYADARPTGDYDFFVSTDSDTEKKIREVLTEFGYGSTLPETNTKLLQDGKVIMLGVKPMRIDLLCHIDGVEFDEAWKTKVSGKLGGVPVQFISLDLLIKNKTASGRPKDLRDVAVLEGIKD